MGAPAGWYEDEEQPGRLRYWDGDRWTEHVSRPLIGLERAAGPIDFDPDHRPQHAAYPPDGVPIWVWLGPLLVVAGGGGATLALWLLGALTWAASPFSAH